jgi:hypothetical protein
MALLHAFGDHSRRLTAGEGSPRAKTGCAPALEDRKRTTHSRRWSRALLPATSGVHRRQRRASRQQKPHQASSPPQHRRPYLRMQLAAAPLPRVHSARIPSARNQGRSVQGASSCRRASWVAGPRRAAPRLPPQPLAGPSAVTALPVAGHEPMETLPAPREASAGVGGVPQRRRTRCRRTEPRPGPRARVRRSTGALALEEKGGPHSTRWRRRATDPQWQAERANATECASLCAQRRWHAARGAELQARSSRRAGRLAHTPELAPLAASTMLSSRLLVLAGIFG